MKTLIKIAMLLILLLTTNLCGQGGTKISETDSVDTYEATLIFAVQKKIAGTYTWRKMYLSDLRQILEDSLLVQGLISDLDGTATAKLLLETWAASPENWKNSLTSNFQKIDSTSYYIDTTYIELNGDTLRFKDELFVKLGEASTDNVVIGDGYSIVFNPVYGLSNEGNGKFDPGLNTIL